LQPPHDAANNCGDHSDGCQCGQARMASQQPKRLLSGFPILFSILLIGPGDAQARLACARNRLMIKTIAARGVGLITHS
jgi:hypothetical protein